MMEIFTIKSQPEAPGSLFPILGLPFSTRIAFFVFLMSWGLFRKVFSEVPGEEFRHNYGVV